MHHLALRRPDAPADEPPDHLAHACPDHPADGQAVAAAHRSALAAAHHHGAPHRAAYYGAYQVPYHQWNAAYVVSPADLVRLFKPELKNKVARRWGRLPGVAGILVVLEPSPDFGETPLTFFSHPGIEKLYIRGRLTHSQPRRPGRRPPSAPRWEPES